MTTTLATLTVAAPDVVGPLAVFPLFGPAPELEYVSFAEASAGGLKVTELPDGASVNDVLVVNPLPVNVLLYEGEEMLGAQQNRTVDAAVLVPAHGRTQVAVSCVEHGRWDGSRQDEAFTPSPQTAYPALRAAKNRRMRERMAAGAEARADQQEVWQEVGERMQHVDAVSPTGAMGDAFEHRRGDIERFFAGVVRRDGQCGALVAIGGRFVVLDLVSRPDVFAALHGPLVQGYGLDALGRTDRPAPSVEAAEAVVAAVVGAEMQTGRTAGLGTPLHFTAGRLAGTGLRVGEELIQLSAFVADQPRARSIRRPSQRG